MHIHRNTRISSLCMLIALSLSLAACQTRPVFADNSAVKSAAPPTGSDNTSIKSTASTVPTDVIDNYMKKCTSRLGCKTAISARESEAYVIERHVRVGDTFALEFPSNPSTGFQWQLAEPLDGVLLKKVSQDFQTNSNSQNKLGAGGTQIWTFKALKTGEAYIEMGYLRPWESINTMGQLFIRYRIDIE